jgi:hypothetical protein
MMLKGVIRVDVALRAADAGFSAISVSNHGGNNLGGTLATIRALPGDRGGRRRRRRGAARRRHPPRQRRRQGARAGRPGGIDSALLGIGCPAVGELGPDDVLVPDGFTRPLGVPAEQPV